MNFDSYTKKQENSLHIIMRKKN